MCWGLIFYWGGLGMLGDGKIDGVYAHAAGW